MATRTITYGQTPYKPLQPAALAPLNPYGSGGAASGFNSRLNPVGSAGAPVKALSTPGVNATQVAAAPAPVAPNVYDINTDPALQMITALTGKSDQDAQAAALKQEQGQLLGYGDPTLAQAVLNDPTVAQAAGANPTSTLAQLGQDRTRNLGGLTEDLNKNNLFYSGYRVTQEQQAAQDYQNALAQAAAGVQGNLDTIQGNLAGALSANEAQRIAAMQAAYLANPPGYAAPTTTPTSTTTTTPPTTPTIGVTPSSSPMPSSGQGATGGASGGWLYPSWMLTDNQAAVPAPTVDLNVRRLAQALLASGPSTRSIAQ